MNGNIYGSNAGSSVIYGSAVSTLMRKVYVWMTLALVITGLTAYGVATNESLAEAIYGSRIMFYGLIIAELGLVFYISARLHKISLTTGTLLFILYSAVNGATMASIFWLFDTDTIGQVFLITAGTFAVMAFIGYTTKKDMSGMGKMLMMALIGIIIASVVNIFLNSSGLSMILNYVGVLVFVGLTAYDTNKIKAMLSQFGYADEAAQKVALMGALSLYLDFINLFLYLLRIFGGRRD